MSAFQTKANGTRTPRTIALEKGTDPRGFDGVQGPPPEPVYKPAEATVPQVQPQQAPKPF